MLQPPQLDCAKFAPDHRSNFVVRAFPKTGHDPRPRRLMSQRQRLDEAAEHNHGEIEAAVTAFEDRSVVYDPADIARAGVFVSIDSEGRLSVDRGYVRPGDELPAPDSDISQNVDASSTEGQEASTSVQRTAISVAGHPAETEEDDEDAAKPLPDRLITELTAHRGLALRDALAENPAITFQPVLHNFVRTAFLPVHFLWKLSGDRTSYTDLSSAGSGSEGERVRQSHRRGPRGLEGAAAEE